MGIFDKAIDRLAEAIAVKAAPTATAFERYQMDGSLSQGYGNTVSLPRDPNMANVPFGPGNPIIPGAINPVRDDGRADPRRYEFQVAQNINITETRLIPFKVLRAAADQIDILRRCVEASKAKLLGLDWDIVLANDAVESVAEEAGVNNVRAMALAKERFNPEITRIRQFWQTPDPDNGLVFADWLNMALEDILVLDAWAVWPLKTVGGDLKALQLLDGSTIKPLIDDRGMRPAPPYAAFQQILFGFPRSEFSAPIESEDADGEFSSDELAYMIRNRRTTTVYGYSPVERSLALADIYLRRQQWLRAEYTDGVLPDLMFKTDATFGGNPDLLRAYENILNDDLSGMTEQRKKARILPAGLEPVQFDGYGEKFKDVLDEFLVTSICGHFGVQPSEIGFSPKGGLGGAGFMEGANANSDALGAMPLAQWMGRMLSQLSYLFLGMPRELEFKFAPSSRIDSEAEARVIDIKLRNGSITLNEARAADGMSLLDATEADKPLVTTGASSFIVDEMGYQAIGFGTIGLPAADGQPEADTQPEESATFRESVATEQAAARAANLRAQAEALGALIRAGVKPEDAAVAAGLNGLSFVEAMPVTLKPYDMLAAETEALAPASAEPQDNATALPTEQPIEESADKAATDEMRSFLRWLRKAPERSFDFKHVPDSYASTINKFIGVKDYDGARWYAERWLG